MEQARLLLAIVLSFLVFFIWNFFFVEPELNKPGQNIPSDQPSQARTESPAAPAADNVTLPDAPSPVAPVMPERAARTITVDSPLYTVTLSEKGAVFTSFVLRKYRETAEPDAPPKELIPEDLRTGTLQAGFTGGGLPDLGDVAFFSTTDSDMVEVRSHAKEIAFSWVSPRGIVFEKKYTFSPDTYLISLDLKVRNGSGQPVQGGLSLSLNNHSPGKTTQYGFEGPSGLIDKSLEQVSVKDIEDKNSYSGVVQWLAIESRYFMSGIIPKKPVDARMHLALKPDNILENRYIGPSGSVAPGAEIHTEFDLFFGPKSLKILKGFDNDLSKAIDFGMFDILAKPCLWLMNFLYGIIPNYGVAIIILTILIKIVLWPLGNKSYQSMNEMKKIQPLMAEIREKYKGDKQKMNEELMGLYRLYKINPMGGCLPMILQIPVFFALYRMLYEAIELRHAPFFGWINDLSAPDRLFEFGFSIPMMEPPYGIPVLTIVMGATMFLQQKMSPPPGDPSQAKMMMFMPVIFTVIFINFSSGLVLYWLINNILSIAQQYYVLKKNA